MGLSLIGVQQKLYTSEKLQQDMEINTSLFSIEIFLFRKLMESKLKYIRLLDRLYFIVILRNTVPEFAQRIKSFRCP